RADDELFLYGDRVWRRAGDAWLDISEGLPTGCATANGICAVSSLALRGDEVFAVNTQGLFRWREGGSFEKVADLPPTDPGRSFVGALAVRDDELHLGMAEGIWRFRVGSGDWELSPREASPSEASRSSSTSSRTGRSSSRREARRTTPTSSTAAD